MSYRALGLGMPFNPPVEVQERREPNAVSDKSAFPSSFGPTRLFDPEMTSRLAAGNATPVEAIAFLISMTRNGCDASVCASNLIQEFGSLGAVLAASKERFQNCLPNSEQTYSVIVALKGIMSLALQEPLRDDVVFGTRTDLQNYLKFTLGHEKNEVLRVLFLNSRNMLIKDELHSTGTAAFVQMHPRQLVKRILEVGATAIFLVHNHPSGDPSPSDQDIQMTVMLATVLSGLDVILHDHVIVGRHNCLSMRAMGYLEHCA